MARKMKLKVSSRLLRKRARRSMTTKKHCRFCGSREQRIALDYKNVPLLKGYLTERFKILPSRISGTCSLHQRELARAIKMSRTMALLPFASSHAAL